MSNPFADETTDEYVARMLKVQAMMELPVGDPDPGAIRLTYSTYAQFAAELAPYHPRRYSVEPMAIAGDYPQWFVTADLSEEEYLQRIWRPWRDRVNAARQGTR